MIFDCPEEHKKIVDLILQVLSICDEDIKSVVVGVIDKEGTCAMSWDDASIDDMIQVKGHIELAITKRYVELNWPSTMNEFNRAFDETED